MDVEEYLERIGWRGERPATSGDVRRLHLAHLRSVPFENLDIPLGRPIELRLPALFDKVVAARRGGFCYELNGLFAWLLERLGFDVQMLSARVYGADGRPGPDFDHMTLRVELEEPVVADVGFGDSFLEPVPLTGVEVEQAGVGYRVREDGERRVVEQRKPDEGWKPQYVFQPVPRRLEEFEPMCRYQQTSPESSFTQKTVCTLATEDGRVTYANGRLIRTTHGRREERPIQDPRELETVLHQHFGVDLGERRAAERLLRHAADRAAASGAS